jgi:hypothetical protein
MPAREPGSRCRPVTDEDVVRDRFQRRLSSRDRLGDLPIVPIRFGPCDHAAFEFTRKEPRRSISAGLWFR